MLTGFPLSTSSTAACPRGRRWRLRLTALAVLLPALASLFWLLPPPPASADVDCVDDSWAVGTAADLDAAIACFNAKPVGSYTIGLTQNISLTVSSAVIDNGTAGAELVLEGNHYVVDGQEMDGVRPFAIAADTTVMLQNITITGGSVSGSEGGGIANAGTLYVRHSTFSNNLATWGGAVANLMVTATLTVSHSTLSDNTGAYGGAIYNAGAATIVNSTLSGNGAAHGGGIFNNGALTVTSSTISNNATYLGVSSGIYSPSSLTISHTIIGANQSSGDCLSANVTDGGFNLIENSGSQACGLSDGVNGNVIGHDPLLGPLQDNGGPTLTHALLPGSPAIDAGSGGLPTDQRGVTRPQGGAHDIGAFELFDCTAQPWPAGSSIDLDSAIGCFNAAVNPGAYTIQLTGDIYRTAGSSAILNTGAGIALLLDGNGFAVDGQGAAGVRPFTIFGLTAVTMHNVTITGGNMPANYGGGILNSGILTLTHSTIRGNAAGDGGGIENYGRLVIRNSTLSGNSAANVGGAVDNWGGTLVLDSVTVSDNAAASGGGLYNNPSGALTLANSIIANSAGGGDCVSAVTVTDAGYNLIEESGDGDCGLVNNMNNSIVGADPALGPLQDNGGSTLTHALLTGSPAIDAGSTALANDQRGASRPQGSAADIGAFEWTPYAIFLPMIVE